MRKTKLLYQSFEIMNLLKDADVPVGGAAVEWYTWIRAFRKLGCKFGLLTYKGAKSSLTRQYDFDVLESYDINKGIPKIRLFTHKIPTFYKAIKNYDPDFIIQGCATLNTGILAFLSKLFRKPFIHRIGSDMDVDGRIERNWPKWYLTIYYYGIRNASHISCQNKYQYNILKKKYPNKSISVLHNPFFVKESSVNSKNVKEYIAWIGNFRYEKNLPALAKIVESLPHYKFKIAGTKFITTDDDSAQGLKLLEELNNVEFVGHINNDEIPAFLSKAYCLLNTSRLEGFSNTFLEAWSVGVPVITTKNVNPDNIISDFNVGIVVDDYDRIPEILDEYIKSGDYKNYELICKNYVRKEHDPIKLANRFLEDMKNCIK